MKKIAGIIFCLLMSGAIAFADEVWNGVVYIENPEVLKHEKIILDGMWEFYPGQEFSSINREQYELSYIKVPGSWKHEAKQNLQADYACYRLRIMGLKPETEYGLFSKRSPCSAANIFCNGEKIASYGKYSAEKKWYKGIDQPFYALAKSDSIGTIELVFSICNYDSNESGIVTPVIFSEKKVIERFFVIFVLTTSIISGAILFAFIINLTLFIADKENKQNLIFAILLFGLNLHLLIYNGNFLSWFLPDLSRHLVNVLQYIGLWCSPMLFTLMMMKEKNCGNRIKMADKSIFCAYAVVGLFFFTLPLKYSLYLKLLMNFMSAVYYWYAVFRMARGFARKDYAFGLSISFYVICATGFVLDAIFGKITSSMPFTFTNISMSILIGFDVFFMAFKHQKMFHQNQALLEKYVQKNNYFKKFVSKGFLETIKKEKAEKVVAGDYAKLEVTILEIKIKQKGRYTETIPLKSAFFVYNSFIKPLSVCVNENSGFISNYSEDGFVALFTGMTDKVLKTVREAFAICEDKKKENYSMENVICDYYFSVHTGNVVIGTVGSEERLGNSVVGEGVIVANKIMDVAVENNVNVLVSKNTIDKLEGICSCGLEAYEKSIFSSDSEEIRLYKCLDSDFVEIIKPENFKTQLVVTK